MIVMKRKAVGGGDDVVARGWNFHGQKDPRAGKGWRCIDCVSANAKARWGFRIPPVLAYEPTNAKPTILIY